MNLKVGASVVINELFVAIEKSFVELDYSPVTTEPEVDSNRCVIYCNR